ncbi:MULTISPECIES: ASCH domain-containing protein [unclassified Pseudomonas]|uniref:ASCH domain-containing protein n=1 Tax=unclassified Pseudomonas TaxID=196821 RepID=UPI00117A7A80|nr:MULTISPECIES: ASCH domain-containing protein [unclassified Pseudomonas]
MKSDNILISLTPRHASNVFSGSKTVELRRRSMNIQPGTTTWIYVKLPIGAITGCVTVSAIHTFSPRTLWKKFGPVSGLTRIEFFKYFDGVKKGVALELVDAKTLKKPLSLTTLRTHVDGFQPPQFFTHLLDENLILTAAEKALYQ